MSLLPDTYHIQQNFSAYCRTGKRVNLPGIVSSRLKHYRLLIFNLMNEIMESAFPIACKNIATGKWQKMVKDFIAHHACQSYQVWKLPLEFYTYAIDNNWKDKYAIPYLQDLLAFEWAEMELFNMEDIPAPLCKLRGDWINTPLVLNPEHRLLSFSYPVHLVATPEALAQRKGIYFVLLYRHPETAYVEFIELSPWLAFLTEQLLAGLTVKDILEYAPQLGIKNSATLQTDTLVFLQQMQQQHFVLGFQS